ncbi:MAG: sterol desaturase family protein [Bacteroidetes bacterium]|nr:sterol desaturase family protein [Fibrella sp.]
MERLVGYFAHISSTHRSAILVGGIMAFWLIESAVPLFQFNRHQSDYSKTRHAGLNLFFTATTITVNFCLAIVLLKTSDWAVANHVGLLQWMSRADFGLPLWAEALIGLLLLDLMGAWLVHWTEHRVRWMWKFHLIHHTDTCVDTNTANRHHPGESVIRFAFTTLAVLVAGAPMWLVFLYQSLSVVLAQFNHANIDLPRWADRALNWLLVTPNMHHVHHHRTQPLTDTNYGNIFSIWDRLFDTYTEVDGRELMYGVDTHPEPHEHSQMSNLLKIPFQPYRQPTPEGVKKERVML